MSTDRFGGLPFGTGAIAGAGAYLFGYVLTYLLVGGEIRESGANQIAQAVGGQDVTYQAVGWVFYNAHFVTTILDLDVPVFGGTDAVNFIAQSDAFSPVLYLLPVLLLVGAGLAVGRRTGTTGDVGDAAVAGASVVIGYLPLALAGTVLFTVTVDSSSGSPDLLLAAVLAGVVYPVVFGAIGAVVAHQTA